MIVCDRCGRVSDTTDWWLYATGPSGQVVTRCPNCITAWSLRCAGVKRTKKVWRWVRKAKEMVERGDS